MKSIVVGKGAPCPKCDRPMDRKEHKGEWKPKANQPYWFSYWDVCDACRHVQHYESAKVFGRQSDAAHRQALIKEQLSDANLPWN
jgi:hypothetical protein